MTPNLALIPTMSWPESGPSRDWYLKSAADKRPPAFPSQTKQNTLIVTEFRTYNKIEKDNLKGNIRYTNSHTQSTVIHKDFKQEKINICQDMPPMTVKTRSKKSI